MNNLTEREKEVLKYIMKCKSNADIAGLLQISLSTVNNHVHSILQKMGIKNTKELIYMLLSKKENEIDR